jgi:hypothetical protein
MQNGVRIKKEYNPEELNLDLLISSGYIIAYELLKTSIINNLIKYYMGSDFDIDDYLEQQNMDNLPIENVIKYETDVKIKLLSNESRKLLPSSEWLCRNGVITESDLESIIKFKILRNRIAHELPSFIFREHSNPITEFKTIENILNKIDSYWYKTEQVPEIQFVKGRTNYSIIIENNIFSRVALLEVIRYAFWHQASKLIHIRRRWPIGPKKKKK